MQLFRYTIKTSPTVLVHTLKRIPQELQQWPLFQLVSITSWPQFRTCTFQDIVASGENIVQCYT